LKAKFLEAARSELRAAVRYYEERRPGLGGEFRAQVRNAVERIERLPHAWPNLSENTRRCRLSRFPYGVIYVVDNGEVVIVAIAHSHRDPVYWRNRLEERK